MKNVNPIGNVIDRTAERPETIKWEDIGGLNDAKVGQQGLLYDRLSLQQG